MTDEVSRLLSSGARHAWSLPELLDEVRKEVAGANYSSVFRAASALEQAGVVERIDVGDGSSRYEMSGGHHEHVRCDSCGRIAEVRNCVAADAASRIEADTGFRVSGHQVVFVGRCADCAAEPSAGTHLRHLDHRHQHGEGCGHIGVPHGDHVDYVHNGHRHAAHGDHLYEH